MPQLTPQTIQDVTYLYATNYFGFASYTILIWDHAITFGDEVRYIWKGRKKTTLIIILFLINRYLTPLNFILNLFAYLSPVWNPTLCSHFVRYEGSTIVVALGITALMMMIRVTAIYSGSRLVLGVMISVFLVEMGVMAWLLSGAHAVVHEKGIHGCSMVFSSDIGFWPSASAWLPLLYDTIVLVLTLSRTLYSIKGLREVARASSSGGGGGRGGFRGYGGGAGGSISRILLKDGILYFSVIFVANFVLTVMILKAPPGIQNICAQFEQLITVTMISRITISLRKNVRPNTDDWIRNNRDREGVDRALGPPAGGGGVSTVLGTNVEVSTWAFGMGGRSGSGSGSGGGSRASGSRSRRTGMGGMGRRDPDGLDHPLDFDECDSEDLDEDEEYEMDEIESDVESLDSLPGDLSTVKRTGEHWAQSIERYSSAEH